MEILDKKSNRMSRANAGNSWFFIVKKFTQ